MIVTTLILKTDRCKKLLWLDNCSAINTGNTNRTISSYTP